MKIKERGDIELQRIFTLASVSNRSVCAHAVNLNAKKITHANWHTHSAASTAESGTALAKTGRQPAFPLLSAGMTDGAIVALGDTQWAAERDIVNSGSRAPPGYGPSRLATSAANLVLLRHRGGTVTSVESERRNGTGTTGVHVSVVRQDWKAIMPPPLGAWTPSETITVVIPAKDCQQKLDLTMAALSEQTYPQALMDVIVVDDGSQPCLTLPPIRPARCRLLRLEPTDGHGSGRARHAGAEQASTSSNVLLFLDADMVATQTHVEAHARWHHVVSDAVVLGRKTFVDFDGIGPAAVRQAVAHDALPSLLNGRPHQRHTWWENFVRSTHQLTDFSDDTFLAVVGASVSTTRALYTECGGFSAMRLRGIVDTEFGYRIFTAGGAIIPDLESSSYHQGLRNFATRGDEIKRERMGLAANHLPISLFRPANQGRAWTVPAVHILLTGQAETEPDLALLTVDSLLASTVTDITVTASVPPTIEPPRWFRDYFSADQRVRYTAEPPTTGFPSPYTLVVPIGTIVPINLIAKLQAAQASHQVGVVKATIPALPDSAIELWATRALHRARRHQKSDGIGAAARHLFGEVWLDGSELGVHAAKVQVTPQGMIVQQQAEADIPSVADHLPPTITHSLGGQLSIVLRQLGQSVLGRAVRRTALSGRQTKPTPGDGRRPGSVTDTAEPTNRI